MGQYKKHVFVCTNGPYCPFDGDTEELFSRLKNQVASAGLNEAIRVNRSGCLNQCGHGPMLVVYPDDVWYAGAQAEDAEEIFKSHLVNDQPVQHLRYISPPGNHKNTSGYPAEVQDLDRANKQAIKQRAQNYAELRSRYAANNEPEAD